MDREVAIHAGTYTREFPGAVVTVTAPRDVYADELGRAFAGLVRSVEDADSKEEGRPGEKVA